MLLKKNSRKISVLRRMQKKKKERNKEPKYIANQMIPYFVLDLEFGELILCAVFFSPVRCLPQAIIFIIVRLVGRF